MPIEETKNFYRERMMAPGKCIPGSFRTVVVGAHRVTTCCPKAGKFSNNRCSVGTRAQTILHPAGEPGLDTSAVLKKVRRR